jgi:hypothetical protein
VKTGEQQHNGVVVGASEEDTLVRCDKLAADIAEAYKAAVSDSIVVNGDVEKLDVLLKDKTWTI